MDSPDILFISRSFNPEDPVSDHIKRVSEELGERDGGGAVVCFGEDEKVEEKGPLTVYRVEFPLDGDTLFSWGMLINIPFIRKVRELFSDSRFDAVHGHNWEAIPAMNTVSEIYGIPAFLTFHSVEGMEDWEKADAISRIERDGVRRSDATVAVSEEVLSGLEAYGIEDQKVQVITRPEKTLELYEDFNPEVEQYREGTDAYMGVPSE
ncbi:MAG: glycosyltransferase family 4 protein [Candidatus Nanohaloarchaea archaeon]|nr:glycosyltransferase family 4 protein [Candidatus Nanohaloarchaea archaeon]